MPRHDWPQNEYRYQLESTAQDFFGFNDDDSGAVIESIALIPTTLGVTDPVTLKDGAEAAIQLYAGNVGGQIIMKHTWPMNFYGGPDGFISRSGKWTLTTGVGIRALVTGRFK